jgi:hypothetical protein
VRGNSSQRRLVSALLRRRRRALSHLLSFGGGIGAKQRLMCFSLCTPRLQIDGGRSRVVPVAAPYSRHLRLRRHRRRWRRRWCRHLRLLYTSFVVTVFTSAVIIETVVVVVAVVVVVVVDAGAVVVVVIVVTAATRPWSF